MPICRGKASYFPYYRVLKNRTIFGLIWVVFRWKFTWMINYFTISRLLSGYYFIPLYEDLK